MRIVCALALAVSLLGCATPTPMLSDRKLNPPLAIRADTMMHQGDTIEIIRKDPQEPVTVELVNENVSDQRSTLTFDGEALTKTLILDSSTLPGFDAEAEVQTFEVTVTSAHADTSRHITIVSDDVQPFPNVGYQLGGSMPPGKSPWVPAPDVAGADALADAFASALDGEQTTVSSRAVAQSAIEIPAYMGRIPESITILEYTVSGQFGRYLFPKELSPTKKAAVVQPTSFTLWITQSEPAQLIDFVPVP